MELTAEERLAQVEKQAKGQVGDAKDLERDEAIAHVSQYESMAVGAAIAADGGWVGLAAYGAAIGGAYTGSWLAEKTHAADGVVWVAEKFGAHQIGTGGPHPATVGHQVAHSHAFAGFLASVVVGALVAVAAGALIAATGGLAAAVIIGAAAGGLAGGFLGGAIGGAAAKLGTRTGPITSGSPNVFIGSQRVARMTDVAACSKESAPQPIIEGSATIFVNGLPMARIGHKLLCGATVDEGAPSVFMDNTTVACAQPAPEIPLWARVAADWIGFLPLGKAAALLGNKTKSATANGRAAANTTKCIDPVDVATGEFVEWRTDVSIPGALPIEWRRSYSSNRDSRSEFFGPRWLDNWSVTLIRERPGSNAIDYLDDEGVTYTFHTPTEVIHAEHLRTPALVLRGSREQPELWDRERGISAHFAWQGNRARLVAYTDTSGNRCDFVYADDERGVARLVELKHSDGWRLELRWQPDGVVDAYGRPQGASVSSVWLHEPDQRPTELVRYRHDTQGRLIQSASLESGRLYYRYNKHHRMEGWGDNSATHVRIDYDIRGRVVCVDTPSNLHSGRFEYDAEARQTRVWQVGRDEALISGQCTTYTYNADLLVTSERNPLGHETRTEWDRNHRILSTTDALGRVTRHDYDDAGRLVTTTDPHGRSSRYEYDGNGRPTSFTDSSGRVLSRTYDEYDRIVSERTASGEVRYDYDARGRLQARHLPGGTLERYHYDAQHRPCGRTAPNGAHESWQQNCLGRVLWHTDALGATTTFEYTDGANGGDPALAADAPLRAGAHLHPLRIVRADGSTVAQDFNREGLLSEQTDAEGRTQRWEWTAFDLLTEHVDTAGHRTRYRYGTEGRLTELINALDQTWRWEYDLAGRLREEIDYAGRRTRWERDALGRPLVRWQPDGTPWRYEWDEADRLRAIRAPDVSHEFGYDAQDQLTQATVRRGDRIDSGLEIEYDDQGRLIAEIHRCGDDGPTRHIAYRYDGEGRLIGREGPLGETRYAFDALGLLRELHTAHGAIHIARDAHGRQIERASTALAPQVPSPGAPVGAHPGAHPGAHFLLRQEHDKLGRLVLQHAGESLQRRYHWQHERLTGIDDKRFGSVRWQLDAREQILHAQFSGPYQADNDTAQLSLAPQQVAHETSFAQEHFRYDAAGNLAAIDDVPLRYEGDVVVQGGRNRYEWDRCGRLIRRTEVRKGFRPRTWHYTWDSFNHLVALTTPEGQHWRYVYDAFGRRRAKRCDTPAPKDPGPRARLRCAEYLWDGATVAAQWKTYADGTSEAPAEQVHEWHYEPGSFAPLALVQQRDGETRLLHVVADLNGAPRELVTHEGELVWAAQLDTWGRLAQCHVQDRDTTHRTRFFPGYRAAANDPLVEVELRFANQWEDEESGLYYNLNRYYDPTIGQYASQDPLGPAGGLRTHGYVHNPITWVDPLGLAGCPKLAKKIQDRAAKGKIPKIAAGKISPKGYHGRLSEGRMLEIVQNPEGVYASSGGHGNIIFAKEGDIVVFAGDGAGAYKGQAITSYGPSGPRGESGASIHGGSSTDPGLPITHDMIINGQIPKPNGGFLPAAHPIDL